MNHGLQCLSQTWKHFPAVSYAIPSTGTQKFFARCIWHASNGRVSTAWGCADGVVLYFEKSGDEHKESQHHSGYKNRAGIKLLLTIGPDGSICGAHWGIGTASDCFLWNELECQLLLQHKADGEVDPILQVLGDSIFGTNAVMVSVTESDIGRLYGREHLAIFRTIRNNAEIGIGSLVKNQRRISVKLPSDNDEMVDSIISNTMHMLNYQVRYCHRGQLVTMFGDVMDHVANNE